MLYDFISCINICTYIAALLMVYDMCCVFLDCFYCVYSLYGETKTDFLPWLDIKCYYIHLF